MTAVVDGAGEDVAAACCKTSAAETDDDEFFIFLCCLGGGVIFTGDICSWLLLDGPIAGAAEAARTALCGGVGSSSCISVLAALSG